jgi:hypothetical protein
VRRSLVLRDVLCEVGGVESAVFFRWLLSIAWLSVRDADIEDTVTLWVLSRLVLAR